MAKPALKPVGLWDPQAGFDYSSLQWHQEWHSEVWALFLKLSHLQDTPSTLRIAARAECERLAASWIETSYESFCKSVKDGLTQGGERFFQLPGDNTSLPKDPQSLAVLPHKSSYSSLASCQQYIILTGSIAEVSGRLLILAGFASLLFISSPHALPTVIFPLLQRLNEEDKSNESQ